ncbi:PREDICTED: WAS/WASL-interacting protein family member 2-like, partial [Galeopterus variegatus]|uniref:WAS/WASL-interacting protein family member 2-like n=1 Tax=Galeopterus variegatus TaxID=482537 RepID=A0ABM0Q321_GALVR
MVHAARPTRLHEPQQKPPSLEIPDSGPRPAAATAVLAAMPTREPELQQKTPLGIREQGPHSVAATSVPPGQQGSLHRNKSPAPRTQTWAPPPPQLPPKQQADQRAFNPTKAPTGTRDPGPPPPPPPPPSKQPAQPGSLHRNKCPAPETGDRGTPTTAVFFVQ